MENILDDPFVLFEISLHVSFEGNQDSSNYSSTWKS